MSRTESKVMKVHPDREQSTIEFMQTFHWNLSNSQHIKTKDTHLEERGDKIYSVTETEHYVNLTFSRNLDAPNMERIRALETEYHRIESQLPVIPEKSGFIVPIIVCFFLTMFWGLGILIAIFWIPSIVANNKRVEEERPGIVARRDEMERRQVAILRECRNTSTEAVAAPVTIAAPVAADADVADWDRIADKSDPDELQEYLLRHPTGRFSELARMKLDRLGLAPLTTQTPAIAAIAPPAEPTPPPPEPQRAAAVPAAPAPVIVAAAPAQPARIEPVARAAEAVVEPPRRSGGAAFFFMLLLLLAIGAGAYFYFDSIGALPVGLFG